MAPFQYQLFGLTLSSNEPLLSLRAANTQAASDLNLERCCARELIGSLPSPLIAGPRMPYHAETLIDGSVYLEAVDTCAAWVSHDRKLLRWASLNGGVAEAQHSFLFGTALSYVLIERGIEPLHGTAIHCGNTAIALIGACGRGKSTLAAAFLRQGFSLLTDDVLVLTRNREEWIVQPSLGRLKLFPDARNSILAEQRGPAVNPHTDKEILEAPAGEAARLRAIYIVPQLSANREGVRFRPLKQRTALFALVRNTFNVEVTHPARMRRQLKLARDLAASVPVQAILYRKRLADLPAVVSAISRDVETLSR